MHDTSAYIESIKQWGEALRYALQIADDPFKAPELNVEASRHVVQAAWDMQIEYAAMIRRDS